MRTQDVVVVMGVSGAGKSFFGRALAGRLGHRFIDADDLHPTVNKEKMRRGIPLDDADRWPWLDTVAWAAAEAAPVVVACSALRRAYRDRLRRVVSSASFVELDVEWDELEARVTTRQHEFMSPSLLRSQLDTLEPLDCDERGVRISYTVQRDVDTHIEEVVRAIARLRRRI